MILVFMVDNDPKLAVYRGGMKMPRSWGRGLTTGGVP